MQVVNTYCKRISVLAFYLGYTKLKRLRNDGLLQNINYNNISDEFFFVPDLVTQMSAREKIFKKINFWFERVYQELKPA